MIKKQWVKSNMRSTMMLIEKKDIINEVNTMDKQVKKDIIKDVTNLRDTIIDDVKQELDTHDLEKKVDRYV